MWYTPGAPNYSGYFPLYAGAAQIPRAFSRSSSDQSSESAWWTYKNLQKAGDKDFKNASLLVGNFWTANYSSMAGKCMNMEQKAVGLIEQGKEDEAASLLDAFTNAQAENALYHTRRLLRSHSIRRSVDKAAAEPIADNIH